jgi:hypothetical protein
MASHPDNINHAYIIVSETSRRQWSFSNGVAAVLSSPRAAVEVRRSHRNAAFTPNSVCMVNCFTILVHDNYLKLGT